MIKKRYFWQKIEELNKNDKDEIKHILEQYEEERRAKLLSYEQEEQNEYEENLEESIYNE